MRQITMGQALNEALRFAMERDERVFVIGEEVATGIFPTTKGLVDLFGAQRVINSPLSESGFTGLAVGAANAGLRPVVEFMFMDFTTLALDMIANWAGKLRYMSGGQIASPVVFRILSGSGRRGGAVHSQNLVAWYLHSPGVKVVVPSNPYDAKGMLISAIEDPDPAVFVENRLLYGQKGPVPEDGYRVPFGEANIVREGADVSLVTYGRMVHVALDAARKLEAKGIDVEVIDLRSLAPLDEETVVESVRKTLRLVTLDDGCERAGVGSEITAVVMRQIGALRSPVRTIAAPDAPTPVSPGLEDIYYPTADTVTARIEAMLGLGGVAERPTPGC
jgi:pyruvate dehydrogenase E1 component beta subunit